MTTSVDNQHTSQTVQPLKDAGTAEFLVKFGACAAAIIAFFLMRQGTWGIMAQCVDCRVTAEFGMYQTAAGFSLILWGFLFAGFTPARRIDLPALGLLTVVAAGQDTPIWVYIGIGLLALITLSLQYSFVQDARKQVQTWPITTGTLIGFDTHEYLRRYVPRQTKHAVVWALLCGGVGWYLHIRLLENHTFDQPVFNIGLVLLGCAAGLVIYALCHLIAGRSLGRISQSPQAGRVVNALREENNVHLLDANSARLGLIKNLRPITHGATTYGLQSVVADFATSHPMPAVLVGRHDGVRVAESASLLYMNGQWFIVSRVLAPEDADD